MDKKTDGNSGNHPVPEAAENTMENKKEKTAVNFGNQSSQENGNQQKPIIRDYFQLTSRPTPSTKCEDSTEECYDFRDVEEEEEKTYFGFPAALNGLFNNQYFSRYDMLYDSPYPSTSPLGSDLSSEYWLGDDIGEYIQVKEPFTLVYCPKCKVRFRCGDYMRGERCYCGAKFRYLSYKCNTCEETYFYSRSAFKEHMALHSEIQIICGICDKKFLTEGELTRHTKNVHIEKKVCEMCNKSFKNKANLHKHLMTHTDIVNKKCNVCQRPFILKSGLLKHVMVHGGGKKYQCDGCGYCFGHPSVLRLHKRRSHKNKAASV